MEIPISFITNKNETNTMSDEYESVEEEVEDVEEDSEEDSGPKKKRREKKWKVRQKSTGIISYLAWACSVR